VQVFLAAAAVSVCMCVWCFVSFYVVWALAPFFIFFAQFFCVFEKKKEKTHFSLCLWI
jgi:hypothetical protein